MTMPNIDSIPSELKNMDCWCLWKKHPRDNGKTGKVPFNPDGYKIKTGQNNGYSFANVLNAYQQGGFDGIGILLGDGLCGVDLDNCIINGQLNDQAQQILSELDSYTEKSPSGQGLHIIFQTDSDFNPDRKRHRSLEIYAKLRFFTVTGDRIGNQPKVTFIPREKVQHWCDKYLPPHKQSISMHTPINVTPQMIIQRANRDNILNQLWYGRHGIEDDNVADFRLCLKLAYYTAGNPTAIDSLFRVSALMRDKWDEIRANQTYGQLTINEALKVWDGNAWHWHESPAIAADASLVQNTLKSTGGGHSYDPPDDQILKKGLPAQSTLGEYLSQTLIDLAFDSIREDWLQYNGTYWEKINYRDAMRIINQAIMEEVKGVGYSSSYLAGVAKFIEIFRCYPQWDIVQNSIPFKNGILKLHSRELLAHQREHRTTWVIPYDYTTQRDCQPIQDWLSDCVGGQPDQVELLRAYMAAVLRGRADLQRYMELIGPGGTGKGTYIRLNEAMIGKANCHSTELKHLENNRFETASLYGKRLTIITDSQNYAGDVSVLKALTGQDTIRYEEKNKQGGEGFRYTGMILIAANEAIASKDYTSGILRRRITIEFKNRVNSEQRRDLITEFEPLLPALINWILDMPESRITQLVRDTAIHVNSLIATARENLIATNPIAQWLNDCVIYDPQAKTPIGTISKCDGQIEAKFDKIYPSYVNYCEAICVKSLSLPRFVPLLEELCQSQLELKNVKRKRDNKGSFFLCLRIRHADDDENTSPLDYKFPVFTRTNFQHC